MKTTFWILALVILGGCGYRSPNPWIKRGTVVATSDIPGLYKITDGKYGDYVMHGEPGIKIGQEVFFDPIRTCWIVGFPVDDKQLPIKVSEKP